jgi:LysR family transcriptional activator of nhaA
LIGVIKKKPSLTEAGQKVFEYAERIFRTGEELSHWVASGEPSQEKTLRIGALSSLSRNLQYEFLEPLILDPELKLEVIAADQHQLISLLVHRKIETFLTTIGTLNSFSEDFFSHLIHESPFVFCIKKTHSRIKFKDALSRGVFLPSRSFEGRIELDGYLDGLGCATAVKGEIEDIALLRLCALRSGFLTVLPKIGVAKDLQELRVLQETKSIKQKFYAITRQKKWPSKRISELFVKLRNKL